MTGLFALPWIRAAQAHQGIAPILEVTDYSQLPDAPPDVWMDLSVHPSTVIGVALMTAFYFWVMGPLRARKGWAEAPDKRAAKFFLAAMFTILISLNGPIHHLSDNYLFSVHMVQHLLLTLVVPYLFILGVPGWFAEGLLGEGLGFKLARFFTRPAPAFLFYNSVLIIWHLPRFYNHTMEAHEVHITEHLMFMVSATLCWWPVLGKSKKLASLGEVGKMAYLFLMGIPMKGLGAFITVAPDVLYTWYAHVPRVWGVSPLADQRTGGIIMWVPAGLILWFSIAWLFIRMYQRDLETRPARSARGAR
ncbi:MAG: cytochrome c oxidase assembly protein [Alphaproteobacteria bacterium]|nr:cytochrome c oxidase assembly protein [Alphaproteobacteria bacterium]